MAYSRYELHNEYDADFPLRFHLDRVEHSSELVNTHWHEHIELLFVQRGICEINSGGIMERLEEHDVIMFSPNCMHGIHAALERCEYYCITVDQRFCVNFGIPANRGQFSQISRGGEVNVCFGKIVQLMTDKPFCYREEVKALLLRMLAMMYRAHDSGNEPHSTGENNKMVAQAIEYLNRYFADPVTVEELSKYVGFSKYYFCRRFKEVTGKTVVDYINFLRCANAKRLITSGQYNVSESAQMSGFKNLSYFSRTYIKHMGKLPSEEKRA